MARTTGGIHVASGTLFWSSSHPSARRPEFLLTSPTQSSLVSPDLLGRFAPEPATLDPIDPAIISDDLRSNPRYRVYILRSAVLPDNRDIVVYVPPQYDADPDRRFPVFYLHDGQNLFDGRTSYVANCTWQAHTTADRLANEGAIEPVILVGVSNTGVRRMAEYTPTRDLRMGGGEGPLYGRLLANDLKPRIDQMYRTRPDRDHTAVGGSSLGGLISLYLGMERPDIFGKIAVLSPSLWWNHRSLLDRIRRLRPSPNLRIWLDMGTAEGMRHVRDADQLDEALLKLGWREGETLRYLRAEGALHDESAWAARFGDVLRFLFPA